MNEFQLPFFTGETDLKEVFGPMIENHVSGIVVQSANQYRLLHFSQLKRALDDKVQTVGQVTGFEQLVLAASTANVKQLAPDSEYILLGVNSSLGVAWVHSRLEAGRHLFLATTPGYSCDGPTRGGLNKHYYPPNKRGMGDNCVVPACPGKIP